MKHVNWRCFDFAAGEEVENLQTALTLQLDDDPEAALRAAYRKVDLRILTLLLVCYVFAYLDRVNLGFAKIQMQRDLGVDDAVYGFAAGLFFLGYVMFEIPSNLLLERIGARKTISRILILWGMMSSATMFVDNATSLYILRFLLGVCEAGFAPGMIFFLTRWYPSARMASVLAVVMLAGPIGGAVGAPVSTWLMTSFSGVHGLAGWQWMFLLEGAPCLVLGIVVWLTLADSPAQARWLSVEEKALLAGEIGAKPLAHTSFRGALKDMKIWVLAFAYFCLICGIYTLAFWSPTIIQATGVTDIMTIGWYSSLPYLAAVALMILAARRSDRRRERRWHCALLAGIAGIALALAAGREGQILVSMLCIVIATASVWAAYTVFWAIPTEFLDGRAAAGGIAFINTIGLFGGLLSPIIIGQVKVATGQLDNGLYAMAALIMLGGVLVLLSPRPSTVAPR